MIKEHAKKCKKYTHKDDIDPNASCVCECDCDSYHTFDELYDHRITLYIALCKAKAQWNTIEGSEITMRIPVWRSWRHSDGEICFGTGTQFVLGIGKMHGKQITYHVPSHRWEETAFAETLEKAPTFDGHSSEDVLFRLKDI